MPSPSLSEKSRRRAPAACTPCRKRHVRCIWSPSEGSPVRCQRCRERELDCVYEPTAPVPPPTLQSVRPVQSSPQHMVSGYLPVARGSRHVGTNQPYQPYSDNFTQYDTRPPVQVASTPWTSRAAPSMPTPFGQTHAQGHNQSPYMEAWRVGSPPSLSVQPPGHLYNPNSSASQTNGLPYQSPSESAWSTSPFSTIGSNSDSFNFNLLSQSPGHLGSSSPPMLDPPSRY